MFCRYQQQWGGTAPRTIALLGEDTVAGEGARRQGEGMEAAAAAVVAVAVEGAAATKAALSASWSATFRSDAGWHTHSRLVSILFAHCFAALPVKLDQQHLWFTDTQLCRPEELRVPFERFGPVRDVYLPRDYHTG
jgi:hypothetical protein